MLGKYAINSKVFVFESYFANGFENYKIRPGKIVKKEKLGNDMGYFVNLYDPFSTFYTGPAIFLYEEHIAKTKKELLPFAIRKEEKNLAHVKEVNAKLEAEGKPTFSTYHQERKIENLKAELSA